MRQCLVVGVISLALAPLAASAQSLIYRNSKDLGTVGPPNDLSGLTWLGGSDWRAVSDKANDAPRLSIAINPTDGSITSASIEATDVIGGTVLDYEGIAYDKYRQSYFVSEETGPAVHEIALADLSQIATYPVPTSFSHIEGNKGLESLSLNAAGTRLYTANEQALTIDGGLSTATSPTNIRIVEYSITGNTPGSGVTELAQYVYQVDAIPQADASGTTHTGESGLSDIAVLPDGKLLLLERAVYYTKLLGQDFPNFRSRIYLVDLAASTPLADPGKAITDPSNTGTSDPVAKTLLYTGTGNILSGIINMEGLAVGPATLNGISILGISDNQRDSTMNLVKNQIYAFEYIPAVPEPTGVMLMLLPMAFMAVRRRGH